MTEKIVFKGSTVDFAVFFNKLDTVLGTPSTIVKDGVTVKNFQSYCLKTEQNAHYETLKTTAHRFFGPCFPVNIFSAPITVPTQAGGEKEGRVVVNMPTSILYIKML